MISRPVALRAALILLVVAVATAVFGMGVRLAQSSDDPSAGGQAHAPTYLPAEGDLLERIEDPPSGRFAVATFEIYCMKGGTGSEITIAFCDIPRLITSALLPEISATP